MNDDKGRLNFFTPIAATRSNSEQHDLALGVLGVKKSALITRLSHRTVMTTRSNSGQLNIPADDVGNIVGSPNRIGAK
jgi:hypothetical protein